MNYDKNLNQILKSNRKKPIFTKLIMLKINTELRNEVRNIAKIKKTNSSDVVRKYIETGIKHDKLMVKNINSDMTI
jgi:hypothetical protein